MINHDLLQQTCKHFRYRLPQEDADELRMDDEQACDVCDSIPRVKNWLLLWQQRKNIPKLHITH